MNTFSPSLPRTPMMPRPLALPLGMLPTTVNSKVLVTILNRLFAPELEDGELDFLQGRVMMIRVSDARLTYRITLSGGKLIAAVGGKKDDLSIEGTVYDFLLLATRREDPDTLFFKRRLRLGGDTELGLYAKNLLDSFELDDRMGPALKLLNGVTSLVGRLP